MAKADRDLIDPVDPPEPAVAAADDPPENALRATVEALRTEVASLRAQIAERDEHDAVWMRLKPAAFAAAMSYQSALAWSVRAREAGRLDEVRMVGGRVIANLTALIAYRDLLARK
jgi:hypothetical protein